MSYYSSHEDRTKVYLAKVSLNGARIGSTVAAIRRRPADGDSRQLRGRRSSIVTELVASRPRAGFPLLRAAEADPLPPLQQVERLHAGRRAFFRRGQGEPPQRAAHQVADPVRSWTGAARTPHGRGRRRRHRHRVPRASLGSPLGGRQRPGIFFLSTNHAILSVSRPILAAWLMRTISRGGPQSNSPWQVPCGSAGQLPCQMQGRSTSKPSATSPSRTSMASWATFMRAGSTTRSFPPGESRAPSSPEARRGGQCDPGVRPTAR